MNAVREVFESGPKTQVVIQKKLVGVIPKKICGTCSYYPGKKRCHHKNIPITFTTPGCNLYIVSAYFENEARKVEIEIQGRNIK